MWCILLSFFLQLFLVFFNNAVRRSMGYQKADVMDLCPSSLAGSKPWYGAPRDTT